MSTANDSIAGSERLLADARELLANMLIAQLRHFRLLPSDITVAHRHTIPQQLSVLSWLNTLPKLAANRTRGLVLELVEQAPSLQWGQTYADSDVPAEFLERYGWFELLGTRGPLASERLALGFMLLGPETEYRRHRHAAEEIYVVLAGSASWQRDDRPFRRLPPGALIHHPPHAAHAMRTTDEPLLALYAWQGGNLAEKSEFAET